ncbi:hypothetical protein A7985_01160 [Pseudoalteromonas luteoviolacea]|uniref:Uncharacterized protein n=1 Tax=Pseudoalteromonas luteoviolacea TaxID=43657 RepID=A0A1C0TTF1_9GAMM|nr:hypothetical protein [Pseudoalteromonas luteoviolacea]MBQ4811104.1 hypothetical protein [Pseudoalteromonas luteoviolacea]OCQ22605.1 hypothetical protein A7985_01160 [Pseudoalteromonas luteoviolacea]
MKSTSIEAWLFVVLLITAITIPFLVGVIFFKIYRRIRPFEVPDEESFSIAANISATSDSFFKILITGYFISSPVIYLLFKEYL